jgi:hypothetical protein
VLVVHHIICDGWSLGIMMREIAELYSAAVSGRAANLPPAPRFSDYAATLPALREAPAYAAAEEVLEAGVCRGRSGARLSRRIGRGRSSAIMRVDSCSPRCRPTFRQR